jgi:hypothetical protein
MAMFHVKGKLEFIALVDDFRITQAIKKCLCVMFRSHLRAIHISKDDVYDHNNIIIKSIHWPLVFTP